ncbi:hypothetical protein SAMN04487910_1091 [Aquimarina amphilecti]|uniref:Glycosyltransferase 2-like domain-containing protein n=1 Tax=Aquimarina amphilecti TaxID=1038014 RepID=A0A1H7JTQ5_AQUAM|nr:glycosyltransferase family 2 protein [Aquimarina amphilecti]SEK77686.1 hypothetical protein SAMN04487910_1091 [Aquimarina amphilecti]
MKESKKEVFITSTIVLYNNDIEVVQKAINSFLDTSIKVELFLIDNSPSDSLKKLVNDHRINYFHNPSNPGFGAGHNIAIKKAILSKSDYHLILNPDVYFDKGVIESLLDYSQSDSSIGIVMPKVLYPNGNIQYTCKLLPTPIDLFVRRFIPFDKIKQKMDYRYEVKFSGYDKIMDIPFLSGCFMFCKTSVLEEFGGFDEAFFMYYEDLDLTRRVHGKYKTMFYPKVHVYHIFERASYKNKLLLKKHIKSVFTYFNKWGWFFDFDRIKINKRVIKNIKEIG